MIVVQQLSCLSVAEHASDKFNARLLIVQRVETIAICAIVLALKISAKVVGLSHF